MALVSLFVCLSAVKKSPFCSPILKQVFYLFSTFVRPTMFVCPTIMFVHPNTSHPQIWLKDGRGKGRHSRQIRKYIITFGLKLFFSNMFFFAYCIF